MRADSGAIPLVRPHPEAASQHSAPEREPDHRVSGSLCRTRTGQENTKTVVAFIDPDGLLHQGTRGSWPHLKGTPAGRT